MNDAAVMTALESAVLQAIVDRRWDRLMGLLDEDFVITTAGWLDAPARKAQWVREVEARHELHAFSIESIEERPFNDVRIALVLSTQTVTWQGEQQDFRFRYTDIWRQRREGWLLSVRHASIVPAARADGSGRSDPV
jgi:ketosteroid isomerase-like protein